MDLTPLVTILSEEVELHESLLESLHQETRGIGRLPASALLQIHSAKQQKSRKIVAIEEQRIGIVRQLATQWNMAWEDLTLREIIARAPAKEGETLQQHYDRLKTLVKEIKDVATRNGRNSQARLKSIEMSLQFINDLQRSQKTYSMTGALASTSEKLSRIAI